MSQRWIVQIDEEKCTGCGLCVPSCVEGAIEIIAGKARLIGETYCDGLGACLGHCPEDAITIVEREAAAFDEAAVHRRLSTRGYGTGERGKGLSEEEPSGVGFKTAYPETEHTDWTMRQKSTEVGIMDDYLNTSIQEVISQFPEIETILDEYGIGCALCSVGSCLLKDIVDIHNLSVEEEQALLARIAKVIYPDREIELPEIKRTSEATPREIRYSPPMRKLVDEHVWIKRWVALIPKVVKILDVESEEGRQRILDGVDFIRSYADRYHHAKEEDILFGYFDEALDILKTMHEEHEKARAHVRLLLEAIDKRDKEAIEEHLNAYQELLTEHIKKEDEILYPWMDRNFSITQVGHLFSRFNDVDEQFQDTPKRYEEWVQELEKRLTPKEVKE